MAPYLELAARGRDLRGFSRRNRKQSFNTQQERGIFFALVSPCGHSRCRWHCAPVTPAVSRRAIHPGSGSGRTKNLRRRKRAGSASCSTIKRAPSESGRSDIAFSRAVRAVPWAPSEPPVALENCSKSTPQVDGAAVFASRCGSEVLGARAVWRLLWWARLRVY